MKTEYFWSIIVALIEWDSTVSCVQKRQQLLFEECEKQQKLEELWQHKQHEMQEEELKLTVENEVWHRSVIHLQVLQLVWLTGAEWVIFFIIEWLQFIFEFFIYVLTICFINFRLSGILLGAQKPMRRSWAPHLCPHL